MSVKYNPAVIREARLRAGLTQQRLGEIVGVKAFPGAKISRWETGERKPDADYLLRLMDALELSPHDFER